MLAFKDNHDFDIFGEDFTDFFSYTLNLLCKYMAHLITWGNDLNKLDPIF
jgi:hypothetical protein